MNKIFTDLVREKIKAEFNSACKPLYEYVESIVTDENQQFKLDDEKQRHTEEVVFGVICGLKQLSAIKQTTTLHATHIRLIEAYIMRKFRECIQNSTYDSPDKTKRMQLTLFYRQISITYLYRYFFELNRAYFMELQLSGYCYVHAPNEVDFSLPDNVVDCFNNLIYNPIVAPQLLQKIEHILIEDDIYTQLNNKEKSKVTFKWEDILSIVEKVSKDEIDTLNSFLIKVMGNTIKDAEQYKKYNMKLIDIVDKVKNPPKEAHVTIGTLNGTLTGNVDRVNCLPDFDANNLPF